MEDSLLSRCLECEHSIPKFKDKKQKLLEKVNCNCLGVIFKVKTNTPINTSDCGLFLDMER